MSGVIASIPKFQFSANGAPMVGGTLTVYLAGTTTPTDTWQDSALTTLNTNPIVLDARGECVLWLDSSKVYKFVLKNAGGVVQWTQDNLTNAADLANSLRADLAASSGASLVGYMPAGTGAVATTVQSKLRESVSRADYDSDANYNAAKSALAGRTDHRLRVEGGTTDRLLSAKLNEIFSVKDFGAVGDGVANDTVAFQAAIAAATPNKTIYIPNGTYKITSTLTVNHACSFIGESRFQTVILGTGFGVDIAIFDFTGAELDPIQNIRFENINIWSDNNNARGIKAVWVNMSQFRNLYFYQLYKGFYGDYCWSNTFDNINSFSVTASTFTLNDQCNNIDFNRVVFTGGTGIEVLQGGANLTFTTCDFEGITNVSGYGINIAPVTGKTFEGITISGCYFEGIKGTGIRLAGVDTNSVRGVKITSNYIYGGRTLVFGVVGTAANGVVLSNVSGFDISNNVFKDWQNVAIYGTATENLGTVENNVLILTPALTPTGNSLTNSVRVINNTFGQKHNYFMAAAPVGGSYSVGDISWNSAPAASGFIGWVCVTAGTPGTWKTFGAISA